MLKRLQICIPTGTILPLAGFSYSYCKHISLPITAVLFLQSQRSFVSIAIRPWNNPTGMNFSCSFGNELTISSSRPTIHACLQTPPQLKLVDDDAHSRVAAQYQKTYQVLLAQKERERRQRKVRSIGH
jgi:hypothetical protein